MTSVTHGRTPGLQTAFATNPSIFPPSTSLRVVPALCGPPQSTKAAWYGLMQSPLRGSGLQTVGTPFASIGTAVGARIRAEVVIEGAILLHDHDHVLDLL